MDETEIKEKAVEEKAGRMGWVPGDKFRGDETKWISAEKFIERGETEIPIMRERMKKMDGTVVTLNDTISQMKKTFSEFREFHTKAEERAYNKALKEITEKQREAAAAGNVEIFDELEEEKIKVAKPVKIAEPAETEDTEAMADFDNWKDKNEWYDTDSELTAYAQSISTYIQNTKNIGGKKLYEAVTKDVKKRFPDKFENPERNKPNTVEGGGNAPATVDKSKQTFVNLPKDAQAACNRFMKEYPGFTKEEYCKNYDWD